MSEYKVTTEGEEPNTEPVGRETHYGVVLMTGRDTCQDIVPPTPGISKEHAAFIVRACNCHDELVRALEDILCNVNTAGRSFDIAESALNKAKGDA